MKKALSIVLALVMVFSLFSVAVSAESDELIITVANDLHYNLNASLVATKRNSIDEDFAHINSSCRLVNESVAIIKAFLEKAGESETDIVILPGDFSWALKLEDTKADFEFLSRLNGKKIILKGNHDLWWSTVKKLKEFFAENKIDNVEILFNNTIVALLFVFFLNALYRF